MLSQNALMRAAPAGMTGFVAFKGKCFLTAECGEPLAQFCEIHLMPVKFRAIHTGESGFASHADAARAAHAHAVHHE